MLPEVVHELFADDAQQSRACWDGPCGRGYEILRKQLSMETVETEGRGSNSSGDHQYSLRKKHSEEREPMSTVRDPVVTKETVTSDRVNKVQESENILIQSGRE